MVGYCDIQFGDACEEAAFPVCLWCLYPLSAYCGIVVGAFYCRFGGVFPVVLTVGQAHIGTSWYGCRVFYGIYEIAFPVTQFYDAAFGIHLERNLPMGIRTIIAVRGIMVKPDVLETLCGYYAVVDG